MADLPLAVRGMLRVASDGFLDQVEDQAHGLGHGVGIVREFLMHEHERQRRSRAHARLRDTFGLPLDDGGSRERSRIEELAVELATAMIFDLGVAAAVVGAVMMALAQLSHVAQRAARQPDEGGGA